MIAVGDYVSLACVSTKSKSEISSGDKGFVATMQHQAGGPEVTFVQGIEAKSKNEFVLIDDTKSWDLENSFAENSGDTYKLTLFTTGTNKSGVGL